MFQPETHLAIRARIVALLMVVLALTGFFGGPSRSVGVLSQGDALSRSPWHQQIRVKPRGPWLIRQADIAYDALATRWSVAHGRPYGGVEHTEVALGPFTARPGLRTPASAVPAGRETRAAPPAIATSGSRGPPAA